MTPIRLLTVLLLLAGLATAQVKAGDGGATAGDRQTTQEKKPPQKTDAKQEKKPEPPPLDTKKLLQRSLDSAKRERDFLEAVRRSGGLLPRFLRTRDLSREMMAKYTPSMMGPAIPEKRKARLLGDGEKKKLAADVIFTVESVPVTQSEFDEFVAYLRSYPRKDSVVAVETLAIEALIRQKAGQGVYPEKSKVARQIMDEISKRVKSGKKFGDLVGSYTNDESTKATGGKLGFMLRADMDPAYAKAAFGLKVGQTSGVVSAEDGFHLIRVLGLKKGDTPDRDKIHTAHIVRYYTADAAGLEYLHRRIAEGKVDVAFRDAELRKLAPAQFR